jgi:hypothetical protein
VAGVGQTFASISITPPIHVVKEIGEYYNLSVGICNVKNLSAVSFTIVYNSSFLKFSQIFQQSFFPPPPGSSFQYQANGSLGFVKVNLFLASFQAPLSGNGTLINVSFKVVQAPTSCIVSTIAFGQVTMLDSSGTSIPCDSVGAVCFWGSVGLDPGPGLLTMNTNGDTFVLGDLVFVFSSVTFNGQPVANKIVAFEVVNPLGNTILVGQSFSDLDGIASISFRLPELVSSLRVWTAYSTVELDQQVYSGMVHFRVENIVQAVGGYSFTLQAAGKPANPLPFYITLLLLSTLLSIARRPRRRKLRS